MSSSARLGRSPARKKQKQSLGWLEKTLAGITSSIAQAVFTEEHSRKAGWLQQLDPRAKLGMFLAMVLAGSFTGSFPVLVGLYLVTLLAARLSQVPFDFFVKRVWLGIPFFAGIVVVPSIFFTPGERPLSFTVGSLIIGPSIPGLIGASIFISRVAVSVSLAVLLVVTTPWADLLKSLQALHVPQVFILLLSMTYRYIFLFLRSAVDMFEARKSRMVGWTSGKEQRKWIAGSVGNLMNRSFKMSNDVYSAMLARGFTGETRSFNTFRMEGRDWTALFLTIGVAAAAVFVQRFIR
ncbi:MAG: Cobalt transporter component CbiQ [Chloroflexi bacterium]|nr:Cobalt transporter component CbiQ [Chloroflexota bacterium]